MNIDQKLRLLDCLVRLLPTLAADTPGAATIKNMTMSLATQIADELGVK